jgi:GT2 family glycosyltransferase
MIDISYVVSCYSWPKQLRTILASLDAQTHDDCEVIVTDNSTDRAAISANRGIVKQFDNRFLYVHSAPKIKVSDC